MCGSFDKLGAMQNGGCVERRREVKALVDAVVANIEAGRAVETPFFHLEFDRVFPDDSYAEMLAAMPAAADYRPLPGRNNGNLREDGTSTRVKIDLFPEYIRHLSSEKLPVWDTVGRTLCCEDVQAAFMRRLAPGLQRRFGKDFAPYTTHLLPSAARETRARSRAPQYAPTWTGTSAP